jgi:hypothetical protein
MNGGDADLAGTTNPIGNVSIEASNGFCFVRTEQTTRIGFSHYINVVGESLYASVSMCDVCPLDLD